MTTQTMTVTATDMVNASMSVDDFNYHLRMSDANERAEMMASRERGLDAIAAGYTLHRTSPAQWGLPILIPAKSVDYTFESAGYVGTLPNRRVAYVMPPTA